MNEIIVKYPFIKQTNSVEEYIDPTYYSKLLKPYIFGNLTDLDVFDQFNASLYLDENSNILELGCGSGRATKVFLDRVKKYRKLDLVDLSERMLSYSQKRFLDSRVNFIKNDISNFLQNTNEQYDYVFSLWSFSHSLHQQFHKIGNLDKAYELLSITLREFITKKLKKNGSFFLIHFDSCSDEQSILMNLWSKVFPFFSVGIKSPSYNVIYSTMSNLNKEGAIDLKIKHLHGKEIEYKNIHEAIEVFLNFHAESFFNNSLNIKEIIAFLENEFLKRMKNDKIYIKPSCYIFEIKKNE